MLWMIFIFALGGPYFDSLDQEITGLPTVCIIPPNDVLITESVKDQYIKATKDAVMEWQYKLQEHAKQPNNWQIKVDDSNCTITITYQRYYDDFANPNHNDILGVYWPDSKRIDLFFQQFKSCGEQGEIRCYYNDVIPARELAINAKHEFGHALGLGHYITNQQYDSLGVATSIMNPQGNTVNDQNKIRDVDIQAVYEIYGQDGFKQIRKSISQLMPTYTVFPQWTNMVINWMYDGKIAKDDAVKAMQYLVDMRIIR